MNKEIPLSHKGSKYKGKYVVFVDDEEFIWLNDLVFYCVNRLGHKEGFPEGTYFDEAELDLTTT